MATIARESDHQSTDVAEVLRDPHDVEDAPFDQRVADRVRPGHLVEAWARETPDGVEVYTACWCRNRWSPIDDEHVESYLVGGCGRSWEDHTSAERTAVVELCASQHVASCVELAGVPALVVAHEEALR